jgi:hypothetical protein
MIDKASAPRNGSAAQGKGLLPQHIAIAEAKGQHTACTHAGRPTTPRPAGRAKRSTIDSLSGRAIVSLDDLLNDLERRRAQALAMGGPERLARRKAAGVLNARERIDLLFDSARKREPQNACAGRRRDLRYRRAHRGPRTACRFSARSRVRAARGRRSRSSPGWTHARRSNTSATAGLLHYVLRQRLAKDHP